MILTSELYTGSYAYEIILKTGQRKYYFNNVPELKNKIIKRIDADHNTVMPYSPLGNTVLNSTSFIKAFLTLVSGGKEVVVKYPLANLYNFSAVLQTDFINYNLDLNKCYVEFAPGATITADQSLILTFFYTDRLLPVYEEINKFKISYIEAIIKNTTDQKLFFDWSSYNKLKQKKIIGIQTFYYTSGTYYSPDNRQLADYRNLFVGFLNLWTGNDQFVNNLHLVKLFHYSQKIKKIFFYPRLIDWEKSFIDIKVTTYLTENRTIFIPVYYLD